MRDFHAIVEATEPFALVRFHDGEHAILENVPYSAASKWTIVGEEVWLREELGRVLRPSLDRFFVGISPPCCAPTAAQYFRRHTTANRSHITYATIFSNRNYRRIPVLRARFKDAVVVSSGHGDFKVPGNGVTQKWQVDDLVEKLLEVDRPILVAAGPCSNIIIHRYWERQDKGRRQFILDVGAAIDPEIHGKKTRHYQDVKSKALYHECVWDKWAPFAPISQDQRDRAERAARQHEIFKNMQGKKVPSARGRRRSGSSYVTGSIKVTKR